MSMACEAIRRDLQRFMRRAVKVRYPLMGQTFKIRSCRSSQCRSDSGRYFLANVVNFGCGPNRPRWGSHDAHLVACNDLSVCGWRAFVGAFHASHANIGGHEVTLEEINGILTRIPCIGAAVGTQCIWHRSTTPTRWEMVLF